MRLLPFIIAIFSLSCISDIKSRNEEHTSNKAALSDLADTYFSKLTELGDFNGVVLLKQGEKVVLKKAYNMQSDTTSTLYVHKESQFDLRSIAKLFAKLSVIKLEKEGKLTREDKLSRFIPDFPNADNITIQHLMTNTSGLPRSFEVSEQAYIEMTPEEVVTLASKSALEFEPGQNELYSNVGFQLLYYVIGKVTNSSFEAYINQAFFESLEMDHSGSNFYNGKDRKQHYAFGHYEKNGKILCECTFPDDEMKMGNLFSTVEDLDKFLSSLNQTSFQDLIHEGIISHSGGTRGKRAYVERNFTSNYTLIFLSNYDQIPFEQIIKDARLILEGKDVVIPKAVNRKSIDLPIETLKQYEGTYDLIDAGHILLTIKLENDSLYIYQKGQNNGAILPESETVFFSDKTSKESIEFVKIESGNFDLLIDFQGVQWKGENITPKN
jgi:CubicO group peptidase (beta-lactamase class C family)